MLSPQQFEKKFETKSTEELKAILAQPADYQENAIQAAISILQKRGVEVLPAAHKRQPTHKNYKKK